MPILQMCVCVCVCVLLFRHTYVVFGWFKTDSVNYCVIGWFKTDTVKYFILLAGLKLTRLSILFHWPV